MGFNGNATLLNPRFQLPGGSCVDLFGLKIPTTPSNGGVVFDHLWVYDIFNILNMSYNTYKNHSKLLSALDNPKRIEIIQVLKDRCVRVSELIDMTGMAQSNISQHMQVLRREGVVVTKREGKEILYCLSHPKFVSILENIHEILVDRKQASKKIKHAHLPETPTIIDPVCRMRVTPKHSVFTHSYKRTTYYFCASGCKKKFIHNPGQYVD